MHAGNGGRDVIGNDKGVGVSERMGRTWNFTGVVLCLKETRQERMISASQKKTGLKSLQVENI